MKRFLVSILLTAMIAGIVPISVSAADAPFSDVAPDAWYADAAKFVYSEELMLGVGQNLFAPNANVTRAMVPTVLWRMEGCPRDFDDDSDYKVYYADAYMEDKWYGSAVRWAHENGIVNGYPIIFEPDDAPTGIFRYFAAEKTITREELATILFRYAKMLGLSNISRQDDLNRFADAASVSAFAKEAVQWCVAVGILNGIEENGAQLLNPQGSATRAELAVMIERFCGMKKA